MTGSGMSSHSAEIPNGTYQDEIGTTTIKITCNDSAGFSVYAVGFTGDTIGEANSTKLVGRNTNSLISTSTATSGDNSAWAMKLGTSGTATYPVSLQNGFGSYSAVPASYTKVATRLAGTDAGTGATGSTITTTYASFISRTQPADTYDGKVKYTLVHPNDAGAPPQPQPSTPGYITYYANASSAVGTMANQSANNNSIVTLYASNFSNIGYGFAGWSDVYDYATNPNAHFYGPNEDFTTPSDFTTKGLSLYAVWVESEGSLQDSAKVTSLCGTNGTGGTLTKAPTNGTANLSSVTALTDQRDNQTYAIAKLADGNCWMIENLRLENTATTGVTNTALAQGYSGVFTGLANPEDPASFANVTTANSLYSIDGTTENTISGDAQNKRFPRYNNYNTQQRAEGTSNININTYSYGNYYTWSAAIADTVSGYSGDFGTTSICPTGWRLPRGNTTSAGFGKLDVDMGGTGAGQGSNRKATNRWRKYPNNFTYSGSVGSGSVNSRGSVGAYWSSTGYNPSYSYNLLFNSNNNLIAPGTDYTYTYNGRSVRCVTFTQ